MTRFTRWPTLAVALAALAACTSINPATGERQFTAFMTLAKEAIVGAEEHPKMLERFGGAYDDASVGGYIAEIGGRLVHHPEFANQRFTITVLNSPDVNAFALPGGYVYTPAGCWRSPTPRPRSPGCWPTRSATSPRATPRSVLAAR